MEKAFELLKDKLKSPLLAYPDYKKSFIVHTDASNNSIGAVFAQFEEDGRDQLPISKDGYCLNWKPNIQPSNKNPWP